MKIYGLYAVSWLGMVILAIMNGIIRNSGYGPHMSELAAHQLSTVTFIAVIGFYTWFMSRIVRPESHGQALRIGFMWVCMTIIFEFVFGHYVIGHSWERLFQDYNLFQGRVWILVLVWTLSAPVVIHCLTSTTGKEL